jgi:hypothetical protein
MIENLKSRTTGHEATTKVPVRNQEISLDLETLFSSVDTETEVGKYAHITGIMQNVFKDLTQNPEREKKYKDFIENSFKLDKLWRTARLPNPENRFRAFILTYAQQRLFDDIIDGDTPKKLKPEDRVTYAEERIHNLENGTLDETDSIDAFAIKILSDIEVLDSTYVEKAKHRLALIMRSIAFDGERILEKEKTGDCKFLSQAEIEKHFFDLDIEGTIGLTLFLFGLSDSEKNMALLKPLGEATRIAYNLEDFSNDIKVGLCNIPREDADRLLITQDDLNLVKVDISKFPENIKTWLLEQIKRGRDLLNIHNTSPISSLYISQIPQGLLQKSINFGYKEIIRREILETAYITETENTFLKVERELKK